MQYFMRVLMLAISMQAGFFAVEAKQLGNNDIQKTEKSNEHRSGHHHCDEYGPIGPRGPTGPQGNQGQPFNNYASFFLTTDSGDVDVTAGENLVFNSQVALSGIEYDTVSGVFKLDPGTYAVTYFFAPFGIPAVNMYVNGQLILNSPLGGSSTVLTLTEPGNYLTLQYISTNSFSAPGPNQSWASIAIFQID